MKGIKEMVFDFDGVLADTTIYCATEVQAVGRELTGIQYDLKKILSGWGVTFETYLSRLFPSITLEMYFEARSRLGFDKKLPPRIFGARRAIRTLSKSFPLSIVTNREKETFEEILDGLEFDRTYFKFIQSCSDTPFHKPDPRVFCNYWLTVDSEAVRPENILYVGDHLVDCQASTARGFRFVAVLSGLVSTRQDFLQAGVAPSDILESVCDLPEYLGVE